MAIAHVKGGSEEAERVRDAFNYGDMLFQEGTMQAARREEARRQELQKREELEDCTFRPKVSGRVRALCWPQLPPARRSPTLGPSEWQQLPSPRTAPP